MNCACTRIKLFPPPWQTSPTPPCPCHRANLSESCGLRERDYRAKQLAPTRGHRGRVPPRARRADRAAWSGSNQHVGGRFGRVMAGVGAVRLASTDRERRTDCRRFCSGWSARMAKRPRARGLAGRLVLVSFVAGQIVAGLGALGARIVGGRFFRTGEWMERIRVGGAFAFVVAGCHDEAVRP